MDLTERPAPGKTRMDDTPAHVAIIMDGNGRWATSALWPDFSAEELTRALVAHRERQRRFGGLCPPDGT